MPRNRYSSLLALLLPFLGCGRPETVVLHVSLNETASQLREAFNRDVGSTRIVMLASPT